VERSGSSCVLYIRTIVRAWRTNIMGIISYLQNVAKAIGGNNVSPHVPPVIPPVHESF